MSNMSKPEVKHQNILSFDQNTEELADILNLLEFMRDLDESQYEMMLKQLPQLKKQIKIVHKSSKNNLKAARKLSIAQKKYYYKLSKKIIKLIKNDAVEPELKRELVVVLNNITTYMNEADIRDKEFLSSQQKKVLNYSGVALLTLATIYGVKISKK